MICNWNALLLPCVSTECNDQLCFDCVYMFVCTSSSKTTLLFEVHVLSVFTSVSVSVVLAYPVPCSFAKNVWRVDGNCYGNTSCSVLFEEFYDILNIWRMIRVFKMKFLGDWWPWLTGRNLIFFIYHWNCFTYILQFYSFILFSFHFFFVKFKKIP